MSTALREDWAEPFRNQAPELRPLPRPPRRLSGWAVLTVFPLAVALTVFAIGGVDGRTPPEARVDVRDASGDLAGAGRVADRLTAAGMTVVGLRPAGGAAAVDRTEIRYRSDSERGLRQAKAVRRAVGVGTIVRSSARQDHVDVLLVIGKDVQSE
jgi:hypothetical protein